MQFLVKASMPHAKFNAAVRDGTAGAKMGRILDELKPKAAYFTEFDGRRTAILIVEIDNPSKIPSIAEPWFQTFEADVEFHCVMTPDELKSAGLEALGKKWS